MLSINTNLSSLIAQQSLSSSTAKLNQAIERMSTGFKINHAKDNAANYSISTNLTTKIGAYMVAEENVSMGLDMLSTAEGSLGQISDKLIRLRDLATQAGNGTYGAQSLNAINSEANALVDEINRLYSTAEYNGQKLFMQPDSGNSGGAAYGVRVASENPSYTDEEVATMTTITQASAAGAFTSGTTYSINSVEELKTFRDMVNSGKAGAGAIFVLADDLDLSEVSNWTSIGTSSNRFKGSFDGNGHVISNLTIDSSDSYQGLFGYVRADASTSVYIKNLGLKDVNIKGGGSIGGLVGYAYNYGNSFEISNVYVTGTVSGTSESVGGLIGGISNSKTTYSVTNCYTDCTVSGPSKVGGVIGSISFSGTGPLTLSNNYAAGDVIGTGTSIGGFVGYVYSTGQTLNFNNNYTTGDVSGSNNVGGFIGELYANGTQIGINNNYTTGSATATSGSNKGGFIGTNSMATPTYINNASVQADNYMTTQKNEEDISASYTAETMGFTEANGWKIVDGSPIFSWQAEAQPPAPDPAPDPNPDPVPDPDPDPDPGADPDSGTGGGSVNKPSYAPGTVVLQVGISSNSASQIGVNISFSLEGVDDLRMIGLDTTTDFLSQIDTMLNTVSAKQTEYGSAQNRLESALDEISTAYENLVSTRSTIRDADIAEESSEYIRQQILQQASATLLATANQSPSIALQLI